MNKPEKRIGPTDLVLFAIAVLSIIGFLTAFKGCGPKEDGTWMTCHWAEAAQIGLSCVLTVCAVLHLFTSDAGVKMGIDLAMIPTALFAGILPGSVISLCMMDTMRCRVFTRPYGLVMNVLVIITCIADFLIRKKK